MNSFLTLQDLNTDELLKILDIGLQFKKNTFSNIDNKKYKNILQDKSLGILFEKPSTRTYTSFYVGILELGGNPVILNPSSMQLSRNEDLLDTIKVLEKYLQGLIFRTNSHEQLENISKNTQIPIINALSDSFHPCQALADCLTFLEYSKNISDITVAFLGDGKSNVCSSLLLASSMLGFQLNIATIPDYEPNLSLLNLNKKDNISISSNIKNMVKDADYLYTDVWLSMGQETDQKNNNKIKQLQDFQINMSLLNLCDKKPFIMHCLPAHYNQEITKEVVYSENSIVFEQAANRLYAQKALLVSLFSK